VAKYDKRDYEKYVSGGEQARRLTKGKMHKDIGTTVESYQDPDGNLRANPPKYGMYERARETEPHRPLEPSFDDIMSRPPEPETRDHLEIVAGLQHAAAARRQRDRIPEITKTDRAEAILADRRKSQRRAKELRDYERGAQDDVRPLGGVERMIAPFVRGPYNTIRDFVDPPEENEKTRAEDQQYLGSRLLARERAEKAPPELAEKVEKALYGITDLDQAVQIYRSLKTPAEKEQFRAIAPGIAQKLGDRENRDNAIWAGFKAVNKGFTQSFRDPINEMIGRDWTDEEREVVGELAGLRDEEAGITRGDDSWFTQGAYGGLELAPFMVATAGLAGLGRNVFGRVATWAIGSGKAAQTAAGAAKAASVLQMAQKAGGLTGTVVSTYPSAYTNQLADLRSKGLQEGVQLQLLAGTSAIVNGLLEGIIENPFAGGKVRLRRGAVEHARGYLKQAIRNYPHELSEEFWQGVSDGLFQSVGTWLDENAEQQGIGQAFENGWKQAEEAALPLLFSISAPALARGAIGTPRSINETNTLREYAASLTPEQATDNLSRLGELLGVRKKGFVSEDDAKKHDIGIPEGEGEKEGKKKEQSRKSRMAALEAEIELLEDIEYWRVKDKQFKSQQEEGPPADATGDLADESAGEEAAQPSGTAEKMSDSSTEEVTAPPADATGDLADDVASSSVPQSDVQPTPQGETNEVPVKGQQNAQQADAQVDQAEDGQAVDKDKVPGEEEVAAEPPPASKTSESAEADAQAAEQEKELRKTAAQETKDWLKRAKRAGGKKIRDQFQGLTPSQKKEQLSKLFNDALGSALKTIGLKTSDDLSPAAIKKAYRRAATKEHPDAVGTADKRAALNKMAALNEAADLLASVPASLDLVKRKWQKSQDAKTKAPPAPSSATTPEAAVADTTAAPAAATPAATAGRTGVWSRPGKPDFPVTIVDRPPQQWTDGRSFQEVIGPDGPAFVPTNELFETPAKSDTATPQAPAKPQATSTRPVAPKAPAESRQQTAQAPAADATEAATQAPEQGFQYDNLDERIKKKRANGIKESRARELAEKEMAEENEIIKEFPPGTKLKLGNYSEVQTVTSDGMLLDGSGRLFASTASAMIKNERQKKNPRIEVLSRPGDKSSEPASKEQAKRVTPESAPTAQPTAEKAVDTTPPKTTTQSPASKADAKQPPAKKAAAEAPKAEKKTAQAEELTPSEQYFDSLSDQDLQAFAEEEGVKVSAKDGSVDRRSIVKALLDKPDIREFVESAVKTEAKKPKKTKPKSTKKPPKSGNKAPKRADRDAVPKEMGSATVVPVAAGSETAQKNILSAIGVELRIVVGGDGNFPGFFDPETMTVWLNREYLGNWDKVWKKKGRGPEAMTWGLFAHEAFHAMRRTNPALWNNLYEWVQEHDKAGLAKALTDYRSDVDAAAAKGDPVAIKLQKQLDPETPQGEALRADEALSRYLEDRAGSFDFWNELGKSKPSLLAKIGRWLLKVLRFVDKNTTDPNSLAGRVRLAIETAMAENSIPMPVDSSRRAAVARPFSVENVNVAEVRAKARPGSRVSQGLSKKTVKGKKVLTETEALSLEYVKQNAPDVFINNANLLAKQSIVAGKRKFRRAETAPQAQKIYDIFVREVADNLLYLHNKYKPEFRELSTLWYDGANRIANSLAEQYNVSAEQAAGIIASMSPQKDWYQNVRLAELVLMAFDANPVMTKEMADYQRNIVAAAGINEGPAKAVRKAEKAYKKQATPKTAAALEKATAKLDVATQEADAINKVLSSYIGQSLADVPDKIKPYIVRLHHELATTKDYDIIAPDGSVVGTSLKPNGEKSRVAWGSYGEVRKAISIRMDGAPDNITRTLGNAHKIRNFYNNIIDPMSADGDVTMDTHAVAAALLMPLSGNTVEVQQNLGSGGASSSGPAGVSGLYYAYAEAYKLAAKEAGLLPRQMQSVTWDAVRGLFTDKFKKSKKNVAAVREIWKDYKDEKITVDEARDRAFEAGGAINDPSWARPDESGPGGDVREEAVGRRGKQSGQDAVGAAAGGRGAGRRAGVGRQRPESTGDGRGRAEGRKIAPLAGAPSVPGINGPDPEIVAVAERYAAENGIDLKRQAEYVQVDEDRAKRIAEAYEEMPHAPQDPKVKEAYQELIKQTTAQYQALADAGYKFWFIDLATPSNVEYVGSPFNALRDLRNNRQMGVFPTSDGFGTSDLDVNDNPLLADTGIMWPSGGLDGELKPVTANDLFRAVHDAFGHSLEGAGFRARGEENAWQAHVRLFTGSAVGAITSETRGQNSWLNYGPHGEKNRTAKTEDTVFADQKTGLMPEWTWTEGRAADLDTTTEESYDGEGQVSETGKARDESGRAAVGRQSGKESTSTVRRRAGLDGKVWRESRDSGTLGLDGVVARYTAEAPEWADSGVATPGFVEFQKSEASAKKFTAAINAARESQGTLGASVYVYPEQDYRDMRVFLTDDGKAGFALKDAGDGVVDIVSVFNTKGSHKGVSYSLMRLAVEAGGNTLDAFDTFLPELYSANGFRVIGRAKWNDEYSPDGWNKKEYEAFNNGEPDVVFMAYDPQRTDLYLNGSGEGQVFADVDEAVKLQRLAAIEYARDPSEGGGQADSAPVTRFAIARPDVAKKLDKEETVTLYRAMTMIDGKLYPPMSSKVAGKQGKVTFRKPEPIGKWMESEERPDLVPSEGPNAGKFPLKKPGGGTTWAAYAPYFHASPVPLNDQFTAAWKNDGVERPQLVMVEVEVPASEMTGGYQAKGSSKKTGYNKWNSGVVASKVPGGRSVALSRYLKIKRVVPDSEVAEKIADTVIPNRLAIPENTVTPQLRAELEKRGVRIVPKGTKGDGIRYAVGQQTETPAFKKWFGDSKVVDPDGKPLVMYHGTDNEFSVFTPGRVSQRSVMLSSFDVTTSGFFFSPSEEDARSYGEKIIPAYLSVKRPLTDPNEFDVSSRSTDDVKEAAKKAWSDVEYILEPMIYEDGGKRWIDTGGGVSNTEVKEDGAWVSQIFADGMIDWHVLDNPQVVERMKELGYDGVKVYEENDSSGESWFVVDPAQIKSATENQGTFDPSNPDIRFSPSRKEPQDKLAALRKHLADRRAANKKALEPDGPTTGIRNVKTDELRGKRGLGDRVYSEAESIEQWEAEALRRHKADPMYRVQLAKEVAESRRETDAVEQRSLGQYLRELENRSLAGENVRAELLIASEAAEASGESLARAFRARQEDLAPDFSIVGLIRQHRAALGSVPNDEQMDKYEALAARVRELEGELTTLQESLAQSAIDKVIAEAAKAKSSPMKEKLGTKRSTVLKKVAAGFAAFQAAWSDKSAGRAAVGRQGETSPLTSPDQQVYGFGFGVEDLPNPSNVSRSEWLKAYMPKILLAIPDASLNEADTDVLAEAFGTNDPFASDGPLMKTLRRFAYDSDLHEINWQDGVRFLFEDESPATREMIKQISTEANVPADRESFSDPLDYKPLAAVFAKYLPKYSQATGEPDVRHLLEFSRAVTDPLEYAIKTWERAQGQFYDPQDTGARYSPGRQSDTDARTAAVAVVEGLREAGVTSVLEMESQVRANIPSVTPEQMQMFRDAWKSTAPEVPPLAGGVLDDAGIGRLARDLTRWAVEAGIDGREDVIDAVHSEMLSMGVDITRSNTMAAMSGYGTFQELPSDDVSVKIRGIRGEIQQLLKLEDMQAGRAPKKTGIERREPTPEERELIKQVNEAKKRGGYQVTDPAKQLQSALATAKTAVKNRIQDLDVEIAELEDSIERKTPRQKPERAAAPTDQELNELRAKAAERRQQRDVIQKEYDKLFPRKRTGVSDAIRLRSAEKLLDRMIAEVTADIEAGRYGKKERKPPVTSPEVQAKRKQLKELRDKLALAKQEAAAAETEAWESEGGATADAGKRPLTESQKRVRAINRQIKKLREEIAAGKLGPQERKAPMSSPMIDEARRQLEILKEVREQARLASPEYQAKLEARQLEQHKRALERELAFWIARRDEAAKGNLPTKPSAKSKDNAELLEKRWQIEQVKREARAEIELAERAAQSKGRKILGFGGDLLDFARAVQTGYEMSATTRQGAMYTLGFPKKAFPAIMKAFQAAFSRRADFAIHEDLLKRPNHLDYMTGGLETTAADGPLSTREEALRSRIASWLSKTEGWQWAIPRWAAEGVLASERSFRAFSNIMRADLFDYMKASIEATRPGTWTEDDAKVVGQASNIFSGRAPLRHSVALGRLFYAPRWVWSRALLATGQPLWKPVWTGNAAQRNAVAKVYVRAALGMAAMLTMRHLLYGILADDEDEEPKYEFDPRSSDFAKTRIGDVRLDSGAGVNQLVTLAARLILGQTKRKSGEIVDLRGDNVPFGADDTMDIMQRFVRTKLAPLPSGVIDWIVGKDVVGKKATVSSIVASRLTPMTWGDIWDAEKELNVPQGIVAAIEAFFGAGLSVYGDKTKYREASAEERKEIFEKSLKRLEWDSPELEYREFLSPQQLDQVQERREERRQSLVNQALSIPDRNNFESQERFDAASKRQADAVQRVRDAGWTNAQIRQLMVEHWRNNNGSTQQIKGGTPSMKDALRNRLRQIGKLFGEVPQSDDDL
jgi:hypothetical protein